MNIWLFNELYSLSHRNATLDSIINFLAVDLGYVLLLALAVQILFAADTKAIFKKVFVAVSSGFVSWAIAYGIKTLIHSPRPMLVLAKIVPLFPETNSAFPSGHASFFGGLAISLLFLKFPYRHFYAIGAVLIGVARIVAGVHWPIDILNGFLLGFVCAWIGSLLAKRYLNI